MRSSAWSNQCEQFDIRRKLALESQIYLDLNKCSETLIQFVLLSHIRIFKEQSGAKTRNQCFNLRNQTISRLSSFLRKHSFLSFRRLLPQPQDLSIRAFLLLGGGAMRDRTADLLRAKQALSQLSYGPIFRPASTPRQLVGLGRFELPTSPLSGVRSNQLSYRPNRLSRLNQAIRVGTCEDAVIFD